MTTKTEVTNTPEDVWGEAAVTSSARTEEALGPVTVAHVVNYYNRYPGEIVTFHTRLNIREAVSNLSLRIWLPYGLVLGDYGVAPGQKQAMPEFEVSGDESYLVWSLKGKLAAGTQYEYWAEAVVMPSPYDLRLTSEAYISDKNGKSVAEESVTIVIRTKGKYLRQLPSLYEQDDFMGRFLMLFESFLAPIEVQIDNMHNYFDPRITPPDFLPWLASWLDLELDEHWSEERLRQLLRWAIALHRSRGTKWGVLKYLEIYTGQQAEIVERRAKNLVLGPEAKLGPGVALGQGNIPHTFSVTLPLGPIEVKDKTERKRQEALRRRTIESIIEMQKPAHTVYNLNLETLATEKEKQAGKTKEQRPGIKSASDEIAAQAAIWFKLEDG